MDVGIHSPFRPLYAGQPTAPIWIIGEAPGAEEVAQGTPFVGPSGQLLNSLLTEAGFTRSAMFLTNVAHERPPGNNISEWFLTKTAAKAASVDQFLGRYPDPRIVAGAHHLYDLLATHQPRLVIALGNTALWALTGQWGITKWRGSVLRTLDNRTKILTSVHPAAVLREWPFRNLLLHDLRRARRESVSSEIAKPDWQFIIRPTLVQVFGRLTNILDDLDRAPTYLACDIETRGGQIACIGVAHSATEAICIPLLAVGHLEGYWDPAEEAAIIASLRRVLTHPNARIVFQNGAYDLQYFAHQYGFLPRISDDTMIMQHVAFPGLRKGLDFLSSLYCTYHRYWKDDGKEWDPTIPEEQYWTYNCEDCVRTFEIHAALGRVITQLGLTDQYRFQMDQLFPIVERMMLRGIRVDSARRHAIRQELERFVTGANVWLERVLGHPLNVESNKQMKDLFYGSFGIPPFINRKTGAATLNDEALDKLSRRQPLLRQLIQVIRDIRSANTVLSNVLEARVDPDGRARCSINMTGAETFRFSSSRDAFGFGFNMQNLTKGDE